MKSRKRGHRRSKNSSRPIEPPTVLVRQPAPAVPSNRAASSPSNPHLAAGQSSDPARPSNPKAADLAMHREDSAGHVLTTNQGTRVNDNQNTLKAGERGPSLLEDFHFREKMTHFDHERIPERDRARARQRGARLLPGLREPLAATRRRRSCRTRRSARRSSCGSQPSPALAARPTWRATSRGFAVKFYTEEGVFDLVGNNIPVFFIQDAIKFPDLVHAVKPEQDNEMPQAASAHDTFWDFISLMPESMHMIMWVMSDRAIPRSFRMMEGFGVHTFRFVDAAGRVPLREVPLEAAARHALGGLGRGAEDLRQGSGLPAARPLGGDRAGPPGRSTSSASRSSKSSDEHDFDFDLLDPTKIIPEELVPVERVGRLVLNRNPDNFFAETEQVAFHPGHVVPGIDFTNDPLLQGRLFSYTDTQLKRLGGPNFHEIPINRSIAPVHNNQRDGHMRQTINRGKANYEPNSIGGGCPMQARSAAGGFVTFPEATEGMKVRARSEKFFDHFSQARMFFQSQSEPREGSHRGSPALRARQGRAPSDPAEDGRAARAGRPRSGRAGRRRPRLPRDPRARGARQSEHPRRRRPGGLSAPVLGRARSRSPRHFRWPTRSTESSRPEESRSSPPTASTARRSSASRKRCSRRAREAS